MTSRKMVSFLVSKQMLSEALQLPEGTIIIGTEWDFCYNSIRLIVEGDDFRVVHFGNRVPEINPLITRHVDYDTGQITYEWNWNLED